VAARLDGRAGTFWRQVGHGFVKVPFDSTTGVWLVAAGFSSTAIEPSLELEDDDAM